MVGVRVVIQTHRAGAPDCAVVTRCWLMALSVYCYFLTPPRQSGLNGQALSLPERASVVVCLRAPLPACRLFGAWK